MVKRKEIAPTFRIIVIAAAVLLLAAAVFTYLQGGRDSSAAVELAALSQAMPAQAGAALAGDAEGFDQVDRMLKRIVTLRGEGEPAVPGAPDAWRALETSAAAILEKRAEVEALAGVAVDVEASVAALLELSDALFDRSGSTGVIQEFQQRAARIGQLSAQLLPPARTGGAAARINGDAAFLRVVANAFAGLETELDVAPLTGEDSEAIVIALEERINEIGDQVQRIDAAAGQVGGLPDAAADLAASAARLAGAFASGAVAGESSGFLQSVWLPICLIMIAVLLLGVLEFFNSRSSVFEEAAREQADQNERNQRAILRLLDEMGSLADGDLTVEATVTEDITGTIADSFNYAIEELRKLVATVNETAIMVDSAAKQTKSTAVHMARAADNQAREINAATGSIVSMAASIEEVSGNAERSSDVARHSVEVAHKGGEAVRRTIDGMNAIRETIQDTSKRIKRLGESSQEIGNIVELINDIAEQTNILALNASIQASMAGEAGRGFAVVADEVQRLAERSTNATKQIEVLVRTIQADTNEAVVSMERSTTDVVGGALLAENAGAALDEIEQVSNQIASLVQNISESARQQAGSAADVTRRTTRLREISEQTGKATTATAAAISKLSELASQLRNTVAGFTLPNAALKASTLSATSSNVLAEQQVDEQARAS
ncbi:chemotaxis protein [Gammaproteobacteria bacterium]|jgi:twitching motility protein PilJ|nr:chemotaxis protein [Gammaproteobacteria bacterium]